MKKNSKHTPLWIGLIAVIALFVVVAANALDDWQLRYYEDLDGATYEIVAEEINLREEPGTGSKKVGNLKKGDIVHTTGNVYELEPSTTDSGEILDYWVELSDGTYVVNWALTGGRIN